MCVPWRTAHGLWSEREGLIVRLEDGQGGVGYGEIAPIPWFGTETMAEAEAICAGFGPKVADEVLDAVPAKFGCVRFALAMARSPLAPTSSTIRLPVAALLPAGRDALKVLARSLESGFLAFKWKVGVGDPADERGLFDDLLGRMPEHAKLRLDANGAWDRRQAIRWLELCAGRPVEFVEQPVAALDQDTLLGLARDYPVKLALDESVVSLAEARRWQALGWPGIFVIKPALAGPMAECIEWILETRADVVFSSAIETALGRSHILHAACSQWLTKRALGFGAGGNFGDPRWDGPVLGPLVDQRAIGINPGEAIWNALS